MQGASHYLQSAQIEHFGSMNGRIVGPFSPGMNVVFGLNESGKTTTAAFVGGVLFGWPDARGTRNAYRPIGAERSGTLVFAPTQEGGEEVRCTRVRNAEGIKPDPNPAVLSDIDRDTFRTIFSLDSDELRGMGRTTDVTARLLTAGSGTEVPPAQALSRLDEKLGETLSHGASFPDSVPNLQQRMDEIRDEVDAAAVTAAELAHEDREYAQLKAQRTQLADSLARLNEQIRTISTEREKLASVAERRGQLEGDLAKIDEQEDDLRADRSALDARRTKRYLELDAVEERTLRETIEDLEDERRQREHGLSMAQQDLLSSEATRDALRESDETGEMHEGKVRKRAIQWMLSASLPLVFAALGAFVFVRGRSIGSLSVTALGVLFVLVAVGMACAALVMLLRPDKTEEHLRDQLAEAELVVQKDRKKIEACEQALEKTTRRIGEFLEEQGLEAARGSLRRARALLDEAGDVRAEATVLDQRAQALAAQRAQIRKSVKHMERERDAALSALKEQPDVTLEVLDERLELRTRQRDDQMRASERVNERCGELGQILASARYAKDLDELKLAQAQLKSRYNDTIEDLSRLLLAKRLLEAAIAAWEGKSQPAVYREASELFDDMTDGAWVQVRLTAAGGLVVVDEEGRTRSPELLSLGTCQQLYLALRIALLLTADNVGRCIPVLADDILVNFDAVRRAGAARALATLAQRRQVIIFTCHEEVLELVEMADPATNVVRL